MPGLSFYTTLCADFTGNVRVLSLSILLDFLLTFSRGCKRDGVRGPTPFCSRIVGELLIGLWPSPNGAKDDFALVALLFADSLPQLQYLA